MHGSAQLIDSVLAPRNMRDVPENMADRLIVALDLPSPTKAQELADQLDGVVSFFKISMSLLFLEGTDNLISRLISKKKNVFVDYKMYDIPETVARGIEGARDRGIKFVTVHGDDNIIKAAVGARGKSDFLKIFTITVLTSQSDSDLWEMGYRLTVRQLIELRVRKSLEYGADGIIASAADNPNEIRQLVQNQGLLIATPGVRLEGTSVDDHKRFASPEHAIRDGADYVIVGRPIIEQRDPRSQAKEIIRRMELGQSS